MQSQISEISSVLVEVSVEVPWDRVKEAIEGSYQRLSRSAKVRGFRPGKVPRSVLQQLFGPRVSQDVTESLVQAGLGQAVTTHKLSVVSDPVLESAPQITQGSPLTFKAKVEVNPKIENVDTTGLALSRKPSSVSDAEVDAAIETMRHSNAELVAPAEARPATETDVLICSYSVAIDGTPRPDLTAEDQAFDLSGNVAPELRAALLGKQPGERVSAEMTLRTERTDAPRQQGVFDIEIKELKERRLPALDDEFAKDLNLGSLEELRAMTRQQLEASAKERSENDLRDQLIDQLIAKNPLEVPPTVVDRHYRAMIDEYARAIRSGVRLDRPIDGLRADCQRRVHAGLLLGAVATTRGISVQPEDLDKEFAEIAERTGKHIAKVRAEMRGEQRQMLQSQILEEKLLEYLFAQATIEDQAG